MTELMYKIANEPAPDLYSLRPDLPRRLAEVIALALEKPIEQRYQDGALFAADLRSAGAMGTVTTEPGTAMPDLPDNRVDTMNRLPFTTTIVSPERSLPVYEPTEILPRPPGSD
jgi:hypothetical protein